MRTTGGEGEESAAGWLRRQGFEVLDRNWRHGRDEIDIVARRGGVVAFVEVKTRRLGPGGPPASAVDARKRRRMIRAARAWIGRHPGTAGEFRFDILEVVTAPGDAPLIEHRPDAFHADEC